MADRTVAVNFKANVADYISKVGAAGKATGDFGKKASDSAKSHTAAWKTVSTGLLVAGAAIGIGVLGAVKAYAEFDASMSKVAAVAGASAQQQEALAQAAIKAGQATVFSASQAADAEAELAKAGISVKDILGGALTGSLNLAAAGQIDLAESATIAAQAMNIFKLRGADVGHIADVLTAGANKSAAGVDDLGMALKQGGLVAKQTGLSLEETVGALSAFADRGLIAADAGTSLKSMLQRLTPTSQEAADLMKQLGISAYDAQGNFVGLSNFAGVLQKSLGGMTVEQRNAALATIFGSDAVRGATVLYELGAKGVDEYVKAVNDQGAAQRMASRMTDNLKGDLEQLRGSLETVFIQGGKGANAGARSLVQSLTGLVNKFGELPPELQANIVKGAAFSAVMLVLTGGTIKAATAVLALSKAMAVAGVSTVAQMSALKSLSFWAGATVTALVAVANADRIFGNSVPTVNVNALTKEILGANNALRVINENISGTAAMNDRFDSGIRDVGDALRAAFDPSVSEQIDNVIGGLKEAFGGTDVGNIQVATNRLNEVDQALAKLATGGNAQAAAQAFDQITAVAASQGISLDQLKEKFPAYMAALDQAAVSGPAAAGGIGQVTDAFNADKKAAEDAKTALDNYVQSLINAGLKVLDVRQAQRDFKDALAEVNAAIKENGTTLNVNSAHGRANQAVLDGIARKALNLADAVYQETGSEAAMQGSLAKSRTALYNTAIRFGLTDKQAQAYVKTVLGIPPAKKTNVTAQTAAAQTNLQRTKDAIDRLYDRTITVTIDQHYITSGFKYVPGQGPTGRAGGGLLTGPGTSTSDSIPLWGSTGEYVVKAAAVAKYGVAMFDQLNAMRFADGGFVARAAMAASTRSTTQAAGMVNNWTVYGSDTERVVRKAFDQWEFRVMART